MLQTIEVEIDDKGNIHPLESFELPVSGTSKALLTLLFTSPAKNTRQSEDTLSASAFGVLSANQTVSLADMDTAIRVRGVHK